MLLLFATSQSAQREKNDLVASHPFQLEDSYYGTRFIYVYVGTDR